MERETIIRTIYLYIFSLLGLVLMTIGGVQLVDMTLKAFVFKQADDEQRIFARQPPMAPMRPSIEQWAANETLAESERATIRQWLADYESWRESSAKLDPVAARRHRDASSGLAFIAVGLPLYAFHWRMIRRRGAG